MKLNMNEILKNFKDEELKDGKDPMTLKSYCCICLMAQLPDDSNLHWKKHTEIEQLSKDIWGGKDELTSDEIVMIKERSSRVFPPMFNGPAIRLLEGK